MTQPAPEYTLRVAGNYYTLYHGAVWGAKNKARKGDIRKAEPWLQVILYTAVLRGEKEPYWVTLDKNLHMIEFLGL